MINASTVQTARHSDRCQNNKTSQKNGFLDIANTNFSLLFLADKGTIRYN